MINMSEIGEYIGEPVRVTVLDHCQGSRTLVIARVYGELVEATDEHIIIRAWCDNLTDAKEDDGVIDLYCLVRAAVCKIDRLLVQ
jgi:hypothetical protein